MQVKDEYGDIVNVFQIYWNDEETLFSILPKNYGALMARRQNEVEVIDSRINYKTVFYPDGSWNMIAHWALIEKKLLPRLYDHEETAYFEFLKIIKEEGIVDPDFY